MTISARISQAVAILILAACNAQSPGTAKEAGAAFVSTPVATFESPWALAFLPGGRSALVTEKPGHVWLVETLTGRKRQVGGVPAVVFEGQGGLLGVALSPQFATDRLVYLTYSEPSANGMNGSARRGEGVRSGCRLRCPGQRFQPFRHPQGASKSKPNRCSCGVQRSR